MSTQKSKAGCRLWRVNIDGKIYEGRWKNIGGAIAAAYQKHTETCSAAARMMGIKTEPIDFTDMAVHAECIGPALGVAPINPRLLPTPRSGVYLSEGQQKALMGAWYQIVGAPPDQPTNLPPDQQRALVEAQRQIVGAPSPDSEPGSTTGEPDATNLPP